MRALWRPMFVYEQLEDGVRQWRWGVVEVSEVRRNKRSPPLLAASETDKPRERRLTLAAPSAIDGDAAVADSVSCVVLLAPTRPPNRPFALLHDFLVCSNESALVVEGRSLSFTRRRARLPIGGGVGAVCGLLRTARLATSLCCCQAAADGGGSAPNDEALFIV